MDSAMGRQQTSLFEGLGRWGKRLWVNSTYYAANYAWSCVAIAGIISIFNNRLLLLTVIWGGLLVPINLYLPNPWQVTSFLAFRRPTIVYFVNFVCITLLFRIAFSTFVVAVIVCVIVILLHSTFHTPHVNSTSDTPPPVPPKPSPPPPPPPPKLSKAAEAPNGVSPPMKSGEKMSTTTPPKRQRPKANAKKKESTSEGSGVTEEEKQKRLAALTKVVEAVVVGVWKRLK
ncbi:hypothetical protein BJ742DRAFT_843624 [Cladochytrium replicatum]|nr:hypothetical protein BJ742DRAFT_843624 [Cladochytrium replicatum]